MWPRRQPQAELSALLIALLKGVIYREGDGRLWGALPNLQARVRDYVSVLGLELVLDEAEGYAFLKSRADPAEDESGGAPKLPRLIARRPLAFAVSLLLALLRKKLAEFDAGGSDTRLVLTRDDIVELVRVFLPAGSNEARLVDQIETHINKIIELGFLRKLKACRRPAELRGAAHPQGVLSMHSGCPTSMRDSRPISSELCGRSEPTDEPVGRRAKP